MISFKNRTIDSSKPVRVYRNLHKDCFSVVQGRLVVAHASQVCLRDAEFCVNEKGRQRVILTKRKTVHAWVSGYLDERRLPAHNRLVRYNPYKNRGFLVNHSGKDYYLESASHVWLQDNACFVEL